MLQDGEAFAENDPGLPQGAATFTGVQVSTVVQNEVDLNALLAGLATALLLIDIHAEPQATKEARNAYGYTRWSAQATLPHISHASNMHGPSHFHRCSLPSASMYVQVESRVPKR